MTEMTKNGEVYEYEWESVGRNINNLDWVARCFLLESPNGVDDSNLFVGVSNQGVINYNPDSRCGKREITNNQSQMTNFTTSCPRNVIGCQ